MRLQLAEIYVQLEKAQIEMVGVNETLVGRDSHPFYTDSAPPISLLIALQTHNIISRLEGLKATLSEYLEWTYGLPLSTTLEDLKTLQYELSMKEEGDGND